MATTYPSRPMNYSKVQKKKSQTKKPTLRPPPSTITNNPKEIKIRFGDNSVQNSMYQPSSILKNRSFPQPSVNKFNENAVDWHQPSDLEKVKSRPFYSPTRTPPRLRTLITPPGVIPYRNRHNLRQLHSPLPGVGDFYSPSIGLESWGVDPTDHRLNSNLNLIRRYPSPLSSYGLESALHNQKKKSYIVVPQLTTLVSPPVSSGGANFTLPSHRMSPIYVPNSQYTYLDRIDSFTSPRFPRELSDYVYVRKNDAFANHYIEDFIGKCIEDQLIPDILLEIIGELEQESKIRGGKSYKTEVNRYYADLNKRIHQEDTSDTHLFSDDWIREIDHQHSSAPPLTLRQTNSRLRYHDLPPDVQARLLADINQELIDFEVQHMTTDLTTQTLSNKTPIRNDSRRDIQSNAMYFQRQPNDQVQYNAVEKYAQNKFLDQIYMNQLLRKYLKQTGSIVDVDDISRLLDANILGNLINQYQTIDENRSRTLDNYGSKKFHLNTFMNITMDFLLTELSLSLIEDMKDIDEQEQKTFI